MDRQRDLPVFLGKQTLEVCNLNVTRFVDLKQKWCATSRRTCPEGGSTAPHHHFGRWVLTTPSGSATKSGARVEDCGCADLVGPKVAPRPARRWAYRPIIIFIMSCNTSKRFSRD
jgi:hypothetical protein